MPMKAKAVTSEELDTGKMNPNRKFKKKGMAKAVHPETPKTFVQGQVVPIKQEDWVSAIKADIEKAKENRLQIRYNAWLQAYSMSDEITQALSGRSKPINKVPFTKFELDTSGSPNIYLTRIKETKRVVGSVRSRVDLKRPAHLRPVPIEYLSTDWTPGWRGQRPPTVQDLYIQSRSIGERVTKLARPMMGAPVTGEQFWVKVLCKCCNKPETLEGKDWLEQVNNVSKGERIYFFCKDHFIASNDEIPWGGESKMVMPTKVSTVDEMQLYGTVSENEDPYDQMMRTSVTGVLPSEFQPFPEEQSLVDICSGTVDPGAPLYNKFKNRPAPKKLIKIDNSHDRIYAVGKPTRLDKWLQVRDIYNPPRDEVMLDQWLRFRNGPYHLTNDHFAKWMRNRKDAYRHRGFNASEERTRRLIYGDLSKKISQIPLADKKWLPATMLDNMFLHGFLPNVDLQWRACMTGEIVTQRVKKTGTAHTIQQPFSLRIPERALGNWKLFSGISRNIEGVSKVLRESQPNEDVSQASTRPHSKSNQLFRPRYGVVSRQGDMAKIIMAKEQLNKKADLWYQQHESGILVPVVNMSGLKL